LYFDQSGKATLQSQVETTVGVGGTTHAPASYIKMVAGGNLVVVGYTAEQQIGIYARFG